MQQRLLDIFRRSGDANIGQTLVRLASLAAAAHRYDVADKMTAQYREDQRRVDGFSPRPAVPQCIPPERKLAGEAHKEVGQ